MNQLRVFEVEENKKLKLSTKAEFVRKTQHENVENFHLVESEIDRKIASVFEIKYLDAC